MTESAEPTLTKESVHVDHFAPLCYLEDETQTSNVEGVEFAFLTCVGNPGLTAIEYCAANACSVHSYLSIHCQLHVFPCTFGKSGEDSGCLSNPNTQSPS